MPKKLKKETVVLDGTKITFKKDSLHRQLGVPDDKTIGIGNLRKIKRASIGDTVRISSSTKKNKDFKVTPLMKKRAIFGLNLSGK